MNPPSFQHWITDRTFGHVGQGDKTFLERFAKQYHYEPQAIVWMNQVHGKNIEYVSGETPSGKVFPETDGLWTDQPGIMLITKTADCVPILLWNEKAKVIAVLHCGWRGFLAGIIESFATVAEEQKWNQTDFSVFLGPHLRAKNFEVQEDFVDQVPKEKQDFVVKKEGRFFFDITRGVVSILQSFGFVDIRDSEIDTYNNPDYFSYRTWNQTPETSRPATYNTFANCVIMR